MQPGFVDDDDLGAELAWSRAYKAWREGDAEPMAAWLEDPATVITEDARGFLADLVRGRASRPKGRKPRRTPAQERALVAEVFARRELLEHNPRAANHPHDHAIEGIARRHRPMTGDALRGIVNRHHALGVTFENWKTWGRPSWITECPR